MTTHIGDGELKRAVQELRSFSGFFGPIGSEASQEHPKTRACQRTDRQPRQRQQSAQWWNDSRNSQSFEDLKGIII